MKNPARDILHYLRIFQAYLGRRMYLVFALSLIARLTESVGILMLLPLLQTLDTGGNTVATTPDAADAPAAPDEPGGISAAFNDMLAALGLQDTAAVPILAVTDATIIGQMAGGVLLVLKSGAHPMREIELSIKRLQQAEVNLRGILFNDIQIKTGNYGAGRYNYYNYQYSYKSD